MAAPKAKRKNVKKARAVKTTFGPRTSSIKWVRGLAFPLVGLMMFVSLADYDPLQPGWVRQFASTTESTVAPNLVGYFGRDLAFLLNYGVGLGALGLAFVLFWFGVLYLTRRAHKVSWSRFLAGGLLVCSLSALATAVEASQAVGMESSDAFPQGYGGALGYYLYTVALYPNLGRFGGNAVLLLALGVGAFGLLGGGIRTMGSWIGGHFAAWSASREERLLARREARALAREERRAEKQAIREAEKIAMMQARKELEAAAGNASRKAEVEQVATPEEPAVKRGENGQKVSGKEAEMLGQGKGLLRVPDYIRKPAEKPEKQKACIEVFDTKPEPTKTPTPPKKLDLEPSVKKPAARGNFPAAPSALKIVQGEKIEKAGITPKKGPGNYRFPPLSLLAEVTKTTPEEQEDHFEVAQALARTLEEFGVKAHLGEIHTGPVITRYEVIPAAGVRVEKIANLEKNIGMALRAQSVRILAPVPGRGVVGIEIPNRNALPVYLREIAESRAWVDAKAEIPVVLGKDVSGKPIVTDLTRMPHLLIAGSTGSGKTVCINSIIASLLYHSSPAELRFIMVDPKIVEMQVYNTLPHMLIPVVTDPKRVPGALKWLIAEMERRYHIFARMGVRNIAGFNAKIAKSRDETQRALELDAALSPEERAALSEAEVPRDAGVETEEMPKERLPYIVCIVDELADLMMVAPADIETCIARLAQLARAAGIHLILATQRPSVNVITGIIKANLPCRIAFKVASKIDSRTILDAGGADALIGKGDMLFTPPGAHALVRAQGAFVSDEEINAIVEFLKVNGPPQILETVLQEIDSGGEGNDSGEKGEYDDDLVPQAIEVIRTSRRASTSMLQRRLKIGYNRAARIMEILEDEGYVGPDNGSQPREILMETD